jgi:ATP-dependent RNA helicase DHX37/DHR1
VESDGDDEVDDDAQDVHSEGDTIRDDEGTSTQDQVVVVDSTSTAARKQDVLADIIVGGALQRNADGSIAKPRIMKKKGTSVCLVSLFCGVVLT